MGYCNITSFALIRWPDDRLLESYAEEDFDGEVSLINDACNCFKTRAVTSLSLATRMDPLNILYYMIDRLVDLLRKASNVHWPQPSAS